MGECGKRRESSVAGHSGKFIKFSEIPAIAGGRPVLPSLYGRMRCLRVKRSPMKTTAIVWSIAGFFPIALAAGESVVKPTFESVSLFKNGLAVVRATFPVSGPGSYRWDKVPRAIHGSFWIESDGEVSVLSTQRMVDLTEETEAPTGVMQRDLAGKEVMVTLKTSTATPGASFSGKVWEIPPQAPSRTWDVEYSSLSSPSYSWYYRQSAATSPPPPPSTGGFLVLDDASGLRRHIDQASILSVESKGPFGPATRKVERPVLLFDVKKSPTQGGLVRVSWLTKGLAWMPAYQVDLTDPAKLRLRQSAVVRNESDELADTEIQLISGFPNVRFGAVDSPLWPGTALATFFQQINQSLSAGNPFLSNGIASQQMVYSNHASPNSTMPVADLIERGEASDDIHYESIGRHSLKPGDSLSVDVAAESAAYERVVEWVVTDGRDSDGRYQRNNQTPRDDMPWDAVRFTNPFKFPMTTAAAMITEAGKFRGQSQSEWVNPGQRACLRITRALSVQTEASEIEEEGQREIVWIAGNDYQRTRVKGTLKVRNFRGKNLTMTIRQEFSGKMLEADQNPEAKLRTEGISSVNPRRQLDWTIQLPAGQEKELTYRYEVLVDR